MVGGTSIKPFVRGLAHWWWLVMLCLLGGVVLGKALAAAFRPTYQATALVQLTADVRSTQVLQPVAAYTATARSDAVLDPVLKQYPSIDRQTFVTKQLAVTGDGPSQTISIQVKLPGARMA